MSPRSSKLFSLAALAMTAVLAPAANAVAATVLYSNSATPSGLSIANGGAGPSGGFLTTRMLADDITPAAGLAGLPVNSFNVTLQNGNATATRFSFIFAFYRGDGLDGGPGTLLLGGRTGSFSVGGGESRTSNFFLSATQGFFTMPTGTFWASVAFSNYNGVQGGPPTNATIEELNNIGLPTFGPPTVGSSADRAFLSDAVALPTAPNTGNPAGSFISTGSSVGASFGWNFSSNVTVAAAVPLPSAAMGAAPLLAAIALTRRR